MKSDGAYGLLEAEDLGNLREANQELTGVEILDSRVSTISYRSSAYNGTLIAVAEKDISSNELEDIEERLTERVEDVKEGSLSLRYEGEGMENRYYSICDLTGV